MMTQRPTAMYGPALVLALVLAFGCGAASSTGQGSTADVGSDVVESGGDAVGATDVMEDVDQGDVAEEPETDGLSVFPSDLPVITEIDEDVDLTEYFPDAVGPDADFVSDVVTSDAEESSDVIEMTDAVAEVDGVGSDAVMDDASDAAIESDTYLADCDNMGVAASWEGTFDGAIEYHIPEALEELFYPPDGILIVGGALSFDIECVDSKLIVSGDMSGSANVSGEGNFPFQVKLAGYFNPDTGSLNASLVDGMVVLYELAEIYFAGDFTGTLVEGVFDGQWTGQYTGTNFPLPPGDEPTADGLGTWTAQANEAE